MHINKITFRYCLQKFFHAGPILEDQSTVFKLSLYPVFLKIVTPRLAVCGACEK